MRRATTSALVLTLVLAAARAGAVDEQADPELGLYPLEPFAAERLDAALERALGFRGHEFCREARYRLNRGEVALCHFAAAAKQRCPEFAVACERATSASVARERPSAPSASQVLRALLELLANLLVAALVAGAVAALFAILYRLWMNRQRKPTSALLGEPKASSTADAGVSPILDRDAERRLERARALAARGEYSLALSDLFAAVLLRLDSRGAIVTAKGRTNGDYARALASKPELRAAFRDVSRSVEAVQFGGRAADASAFERAFERARALLSPALLLFAVVAGLSACNSAARPSSPGASCGTGADGYSVLCTLLASESVAVRRRYRRLDDIGADVGVVIVLPNDLGAEDQLALSRWIEDGGMAVLTTPLPKLDSALQRGRNGPGCSGPALITRAGDATKKAPSTVVGAGPTLTGEIARPYATCDGKPYIDRVAHGDGSVVFLPSPALLTNASLAAGENARWLAPLVPRDQGSVELVGGWTGHTSETPFESLHQAGLSPWLLQLAALAVAFALARGTSFGKRHESQRSARRAFSEHVVALGERWADARDARAALRAYGALALELFRERVPSALQTSVSALAPALAERSGRGEADVARALAKARLAREGADDGGSEAEQLATLRELGRLLAETGGSVERRHIRARVFRHS